MPLPSGLAAQFGLADESRVNAAQTIATTGAPTGGTFKLTFEGQQTAAIAFNASSATLQTAIEALPNVGVGNTTVSGGPLPTGILVTFVSGPASQRKQTLMTADSTGLTGGASPTATATMTTAGLGYGDYVVPTRFLEFLSEGVKLTIDRIEGRGLRAGLQRIVRQDRRVANKKGAAGSLGFELSSNGFGLLFKHIFGNAAVVTTPAGGALTRDLTYTLADPTGKSFTMQIGTPDIGGTVRAFSYVGCKVTSAVFQQALDALTMLTLNVDAKDEDTSQGLASASYPATQNLFNYQQAVISIAGTNYDVKDVTLTVTPAVKTDRYFVRGDSRKKEPLPNAFADVSGSFSSEFIDLTAYNRFVNLTPAKLVLTWTGPLIETGFNFGLTITLPAVQFDGETPDVSGPDLVMQNLPFKVVNDGVNQPITLAYRTTDTVD